MDRVNVSLPEELIDRIDSSAEDRGLDRSEKIRHDLTRLYFDGR